MPTVNHCRWCCNSPIGGSVVTSSVFIRRQVIAKLKVSRPTRTFNFITRIVKQFLPIKPRYIWMGNNLRLSAPSSIWVQSSRQREILANKSERRLNLYCGDGRLKLISKTNNFTTKTKLCKSRMLTILKAVKTGLWMQTELRLQMGYIRRILTSS